MENRKDELCMLWAEFGRIVLSDPPVIAVIVSYIMSRERISGYRYRYTGEPPTAPRIRHSEAEINDIRRLGCEDIIAPDPGLVALFRRYFQPHHSDDDKHKQLALDACPVPEIPIVVAEMLLPRRDPHTRALRIVAYDAGVVCLRIFDHAFMEVPLSVIFEISPAARDVMVVIKKLDSTLAMSFLHKEELFSPGEHRGAECITYTHFAFNDVFYSHYNWNTWSRVYLSVILECMIGALRGAREDSVVHLAHYKAFKVLLECSIGCYAYLSSRASFECMKAGGILLVRPVIDASVDTIQWDIHDPFNTMIDMGMAISIQPLSEDEKNLQRMLEAVVDNGYLSIHDASDTTWHRLRDSILNTLV